jgi:hypothetical protein
MKKSIDPTFIYSIFVFLIKLSLAAVDPSVSESVLYSPVPTNAMEKIPEYLPKFAATDNRVTCHNYRTDFSSSTRGWRVEDSMQDTYDIMSTGLQLNLVPPSSYIRVHDLEQSKQIYISNKIYLFICILRFTL